MYTKEMAEQNRKAVIRAKELLDRNDLDTVAGQHEDVITKLAKEFPGMSQVRIISKIAKAIRQIRFEEM